MIRHYLYGFVVLFGALLGVRLLEAKPLQRFEFSEPHMGTMFRLVFYAPDETRAQQAARAAFARADQLNRIMSDYLKTSELMRACQQAGGKAIPISQDLFDVLAASLELANKTDGALDISLGPVIRLWRLARRTRQLPSPEKLQQALALIDYRKILLDPQRRTLRIVLAGMLLDLGAIGKGFTADALLAILRQYGIRRALVAAGGDITVGDAPPHAAGWLVGIAPLRNPLGPPTYTLLLHNAAVSTSGDTEQYALIDGKRYSHIIDPKTGLGLLGRRSVSVIAPTGLLADGLDTAACVLGPQAGFAFLEKEGVGAIFVFEDQGEERTLVTKRFAKYVVYGKQ